MILVGTVIVAGGSFCCTTMSIWRLHHRVFGTEARIKPVNVVEVRGAAGGDKIVKRASLRVRIGSIYPSIAGGGNMLV